MAFHVINTQASMAEDLASIQKACFPTMADSELFYPQHYRAHIERFPEGQLAVVTDEGKAVACSTDFLTPFDFDNIQHRFIDMVGNSWLTNHDPEGDWLYGADISVHPDYRRQGLASMLYQARRDLVQRLGLRGHIAGAMIKGYSAHKASMNAAEYIDAVIAGTLIDPVLSVQLRQGFKVEGILYNYVEASSCDNTAALIVWRNPDKEQPHG